MLPGFPLMTAVTLPSDFFEINAGGLKEIACAQRLAVLTEVFCYAPEPARRPAAEVRAVTLRVARPHVPGASQERLNAVGDLAVEKPVDGLFTVIDKKPDDLLAGAVAAGRDPLARQFLRIVVDTGGPPGFGVRGADVPAPNVPILCFFSRTATDAPSSAARRAALRPPIPAPHDDDVGFYCFENILLRNGLRRRLERPVPAGGRLIGHIQDVAGGY